MLAIPSSIVLWSKEIGVKNKVIAIGTPIIILSSMIGLLLLKLIQKYCKISSLRLLLFISIY